MKRKHYAIETKLQCYIAPSSEGLILAASNLYLSVQAPFHSQWIYYSEKQKPTQNITLNW